MKNIRIFRLKIFHFLVVKFSIYLNRHVFLMLFGDERLSLESNTMLFRAVQNYIKSTKRFAN